MNSIHDKFARNEGRDTFVHGDNWLPVDGATGHQQDSQIVAPKVRESSDAASFTPASTRTLVTTRLDDIAAAMARIHAG